MRIATLHIDLLSLLQAGVDPRDLAVGDAVAGELAAPIQPGKIVAIGLNDCEFERIGTLRNAVANAPRGGP
jgi:hypothetical protein